MINITKENLIAGHRDYHSFLSKSKVAKKKSVPATMRKNNITAMSACEKPSGFFSPKNQISFGNSAAKVSKKAAKNFPKWVDNLIGGEKFFKFMNFTSGNSGIVEAISAVGIVCTLRPAVIALTPGSEKRDKQYAITRSWATAAIEFGTAWLLLKPIGNAYKKYDKHIKKSFELIKKEKAGKLKEPIEKLASKFEMKIINSLKSGALSHLMKEHAPDANKFIITFGPKVLTTYPRAFLTVAFIPAIMKRIFPSSKQKQAKQYKQEQMHYPIRFQSSRIGFNKNLFNKFKMKEVKNASK